MSPKNNKFIIRDPFLGDRAIWSTAEGPDGSGKSTFVKNLTAWMQEQAGINNVVATHEIGGSAVGQNVRQLILHPKEGQELHNKSKTLLCWVDRVEHQRKVRDLLKSGVAVVQDRTYLSTYAYQGMLYGDSPLVGAVHTQLNIKNPDILFILDVDPETIIERVGNRHASNAVDPVGNDDMDNMNDRQLKDLCYYYRGIEHVLPATTRLKADTYVVHLDGRKPQDVLLAEAIEHIEKFLAKPELWVNTLLHPDDKDNN